LRGVTCTLTGLGRIRIGQGRYIQMSNDKPWQKDSEKHEVIRVTKNHEIGGEPVWTLTAGIPTFYVQTREEGNIQWMKMLLKDMLWEMIDKNEIDFSYKLDPKAGKD
jgi:hypothetical protein